MARPPMQHQDQEAGSNSSDPYSVKSCEKAVIDSLRAEHIQDVHVWHFKKWPGTESLSVEYRSLPHLTSEGAESNKIKMPSSALCKQCPKENSFHRWVDLRYWGGFLLENLLSLCLNISRNFYKATRIQGDRHPPSVMIWWGVAYEATTKLHFCEKVYENSV